MTYDDARSTYEAGLRSLRLRVDALSTMYALAERGVIKEVLGAVLGGRLADKKRRSQASKRVKDILDELARRSRDEEAQVAEQAVALGHSIVDAATSTNVRFGATERATLDALVENMTGRLADARTVVGRRADDVFRTEGLRAATLQTQNEKTVEEATTLLAKRLREQGPGAFVDRSGRVWNLETYSRMVVRTTTSEASAQGVAQGMLARDLFLVQIEYPKDRRYVETPDDQCASHHDQVQALPGHDVPSYVTMDRLWPFHPNCYHNGLPAREALGERRTRRTTDAGVVAA